MRIYLAARYSRRLELCGYREQLCALGHDVQAQWLNGKHQINHQGAPINDDGETLVELGADGCQRAAVLRQKLAQDDFCDVLLCDLLIAFTELPRSSASRGGRHVEFGIALGLMKRVWIVGPRENIFHWMEEVRQFGSFELCLSNLSKR